MRTLKLTLQYDGTAYYGWQRQNGQQTIQACVENALEQLFLKKVTVIGAGRTDAGVHAKAQAAHIRTDSELSAKNICRGANAFLPEDIRITGVSEESDMFHAQHSALRREYRYFIYNDDYVDVVWRKYSMHYKYALNVNRMKLLSQAFVGKHDFSSFAAAGDVNKSKVRRIHHFSVSRRGPLIAIRIVGNAFLQHQVRTMVGTLLKLQRYNESVGELRRLIDAKSRKLAGPTASPQGLWLWRVYY